MCYLGHPAKIQNLPNETAPVKPQTHEADAQGRATLSQQKSCSEQSKQNFNNWKKEVTGNTLESYTNHYDPTTGICYLEISFMRATDSLVRQTFFIQDAFESRSYGYFTINIVNDISYASGFIEPPDQPKIKCKSYEQFNELALKYFGTTP